MSLYLCVRADVKIWQWRYLRAATTPRFQKRLSRNPRRGVRQRQPLKHRWIKPSIQIGGGGESRGQFGVDNWVDENWPLGSTGPEFLLRPRQPDWIRSGNVQQDAGVK